MTRRTDRTVACRHRGGTIGRRPACDTPTASAASSVVKPFAISARTRAPPRAACDGAPGDFIGDRPVNSFIHPAGLPINTSMIEVLRRPVESALRAAVGMMNELTVGLTASEGHHQCVDDEVGGLSFAHRPADHAAIVEVLDPGQEQLAVAASELALVGCRCGEVPSEEIGSGRRVGPAAPPILTTVGIDQAQFTHDPSHTLATDPATVPSQLPPDAWRPVGAARGGVDIEDVICQPRIIEERFRDDRLRPGVKRRARQLDESGKSLHLKEMTVVINEPAATHLVVPRAKYCAARFRISRSCRSSATSLRSRFSSAHSSSSAPGSDCF